MNMVRSRLMMSGIPKIFWPEAVNWSIHILNRSPTLTVQNMTPEETWSGQRPIVHHFRFSRCVAYAHVPDQKRTKLDDKGEKCIFIGSSEQSKSYKLYNPVTKKIVVSRDVFYEERFWPWNNNVVEQQQIAVSFDEEESSHQQKMGSKTYQMFQQMIQALQQQQHRMMDGLSVLEEDLLGWRIMRSGR